MMNQGQFIKSQKQCADLLGITLKKYNLSCEKVKIIPRRHKRKVEYDNSILKKLGLTVKDLKTKKR